MRNPTDDSDARPTREGSVAPEASPEARREYEQRAWENARRQRRAAVITLRRRALAAASLPVILDDALEVVTRVLQFDFAKIVRWDRDRDALTIVAARGWHRDLTGAVIEHAAARSEAGYALRAGGAVVVEDLRRVAELRGADLLREHGVVSGASVIVRGQRGPFGAIGVHSLKRRMLGPGELAFLRAVADVIAAAVYRLDFVASGRTTGGSGTGRTSRSTP